MGLEAWFGGLGVWFGGFEGLVGGSSRSNVD